VSTPTTPISRTAPVSGLQRGLWFLDRWNPGATTYTVPWVFEFDAPVDPEALRHAVDQVAARHEALRTTFSFGPDGPVQTVHGHVGVPFGLHDLRDGRGSAADVLATAARTGFDLATGPLLRAELVLGPAVPATLILVVHHIVWDGWSAAVFERELAEAYTALVEGRSANLPVLATQYADYALGQQTAEYGEHLEYWKDALRGAPTQLELPADRPRPPAQTFAGHTDEFTLPVGISALVGELASAEDATPFVVQLAAFAVLLGRYTGVDDVVVGTPMTTRDRPELEDLVGYFVNIVPLRVRLDSNATFRDLVAQVRDTAFDAYAYLDVPFDEVVDALGLERSVGHAPLVQVVFGAHAEDPAPLRFGAAAATRRVQHNGSSKFDLTWSTFDDGDLRGEVEFSTDLFDRGTVARMTAHWRTLLTAALADPDRPLWKLDMLDAPERAVAAPERIDAAPRCLHRSFEDVADRFPSRPALTFGGETLTYAELDERANRLAHTLIAEGVRPGDRVGLLLDRTAHVVVSILAVLKAGAAYVPVDLTAPADRAAFVFGDTGVRLVLTDQEPAGDWTALDVVKSADAIAARPATRLGIDVRPGDLAYLIFTSGSTGRPKGVAVAHEHAARLMTSGVEHFTFAETDVWTLFHSYAFDWTVWELWGALHHGGHLVVVPYLVSRSPEAFAALLADERVSCLCLTPSALRQLELTLHAAPRPLPALRWVMLGGEALDPAVVRRWFELSPCPPARLCNLYGITETTVHVTTHDITGPGGFERSFIGAALPHLAARVLDDRLQPCPVGVPGELFIAGGALAHGYWGRAGLTAQRFVPDPGSIGGRLYRTGDVARRLPGGGLEYLGRCDDQVKIRGFRIELGEIENAVAAHTAIRTCVVTVHDDRLAAYVTADGEAPGYGELRAFLAEALPDYMIPASLTVLDTLPLTVNGKVDRAALPAPESGSVSSALAYVAPSTAQEQLLADIWSDVLGVPEIGAHDNFFHLGGDSIRAVHLSGRLRDQGWELTLPDLFAAPTPATLGPLLRPLDGSAIASEPFDLVDERDRVALPRDVVDAYPMVSMQLSMIYHMELSGGAGGYHNVNSYRVSGKLDERALRAAIGDVMSRHPVLRTSLDLFSYRAPLQLVHAEAPVPLEVEDLRGAPDLQADAVRAVFDAHCDTRFDLRTAPLFRVTAQWLADDVFQLTLAEHHAILDGWSFTSLLTEILERHAALSADPELPVAAPPASTFRDFVAAEQKAAESADSEAFWSERLTGASGALWATAAEAPAAEIPRTVEQVLPEAPAQLRVVAEAAGVPVKAVALAAHLLALSRMTGERRVTTGLSVNGRLEERGGTEAYGLFLNTVPLVFDLASAPRTGTGLAKAVHDAEVAMLPHRRMPFARLARFMTDTRLDANFAFLRFHSLGRLDGTIVDDRIGCEPTMRYEPTNFGLVVALVQDPSSGRILLAMDHARSLISEPVADGYVEAYLDALGSMAADPGAELKTAVLR
jgi:amino acid adenylation domain-containing protein